MARGTDDDKLAECKACTRRNKWICDLHARWVSAGGDADSHYGIRFRSQDDGDWYLVRICDAGSAQSAVELPEVQPHAPGADD